VTRGSTGTPSFFVNQTGEILVANGSTYDGMVSIPLAGSALVGVPPTQIVAGALAVNTVGADGNVWRVLQ
jgi:hypothetical protein